MNTFHDQIQRCSRHPQQRIVGVCACCLQERLASLIESITPAPEDATPDALNTSNLAAHEQQPPPPSRRRFPDNDSSFHGTAEMAPHSLPKHEAALNLYLQNVKNAHHSVDFVDRSPKQSNAHTGMKATLVSSPHVLTTTQEKNRSLPSSHRRSSVSESNLKTDHLSSGNVDMLGKKKGSWFSSISKSRTSRLNSPMHQEGMKLSQDELRSPQLMISAGRKSTSQAGDSTNNNYRQAYMADLGAIEEINLGETAIKLDNNINGDVSTSSSWISSFFHRRKGLRSKSNLSNSTTSSNNTATDEISAGVMRNGSINQSPKNSIDAGRLSWDGARPDFKQILRKVEARNKQQQRGDCSPSQSVDYAMKQYNDNGREMKNQASSLKKCKSVASARSSISIEMPKDLMQASSSPMIHQGQRNVMVGLDYDNLDDDRSFPRSRSWGRAWSRALSPLLGFKHHSRKGGNDSPSTHHHHHPGSVTPSHVNFKSSISVPPPSSSYVSPLRRSSLAPADARIHFAQ